MGYLGLDFEGEVKVKGVALSISCVIGDFYVSPAEYEDGYLFSPAEFQVESVSNISVYSANKDEYITPSKALYKALEDAILDTLQCEMEARMVEDAEDSRDFEPPDDFEDDPKTDYIYDPF